MFFSVVLPAEVKRGSLHQSDLEPRFAEQTCWMPEGGYKRKSRVFEFTFLFDGLRGVS